MNPNTTDSRHPRGPRRFSPGRARRSPFAQQRRPAGAHAPALEPTPCDTTPVAFASFGLDPRLLEGVRDLGFKETRPIQTAVIPLALGGSDVIGCAETGTGKTCAFVVPILQLLLTAGLKTRATTDTLVAQDSSPAHPATTDTLVAQDSSPARRATTDTVVAQDFSPARRATTDTLVAQDCSPAHPATTDTLVAQDSSPARRATTDTVVAQDFSPAHTGKSRVLVLAPTRELAVQIEDEIHGLSYHTTITSAAVYGGVEMGVQERALRAGVDIIVATPGRLMDHMRQQNADLGGVELLVLDEADRMMDMGFWPDVRRIIAALPPVRQTLLFSATIPDEVVRLALEIVREPKFVQVGQRSKPPRTITHRAHIVPASDKLDWLIGHLRRREGPVLVFSRTKIGAERLARKLAAAGVKCVSLHADRTQEQRRAAVEGFRGGRFNVLVATDIAARGLDIDGIHTVINYEMPDSPDAYVHRVGRTGRADEAGHAITLVSPDERHALALLEKSVGIRIELRADV